MRSDETCRKLLEAIAALPLGETQIMEVCGTHTMAIAEAGIRSLLPKQIRLVSGPGCPVCVTPPEDIDAVLELAMGRMWSSPATVTCFASRETAGGTAL